MFEMSCALPCDVSVPSRRRMIPGSVGHNERVGRMDVLVGMVRGKEKGKKKRRNGGKKRTTMCYAARAGDGRNATLPPAETNAHRLLAVDADLCTAG